MDNNSSQYPYHFDDISYLAKEQKSHFSATEALNF